MKTFILFWNPAISSYKLDDFQRELEELASEYNDMNWSVWEHDKAQAGDRFFMVRCGNGHTGICMSGYFSSNPYRGEDWSGRGRVTYYMDLFPDVVLHPDYLPILTTAELLSAIPSFDWTGGHSGRLLDEASAGILENLWKQTTVKNENHFTIRAFRQEVDPSRFINEKAEPICCWLSLTDEGQISVYNHHFGIDKPFKTIEEAKSFALETLKEKIEKGRKVIFKYENVSDENQERFIPILERLLSLSIPLSHYQLIHYAYFDDNILTLVLYGLVAYGNESISSFSGQGFSQGVIDAVVALLPIDGETEEQHLKRIEGNDIATSVKIDMLTRELDIEERGSISVDDVPRLNAAIQALKQLREKYKTIIIDEV